MPIVTRAPLNGIVKPMGVGSLPASDDFNRANTTSGAGNCSDGVHSWTDLRGTSGIVSSRFYIPTLDGGGEGLSVIDIGTLAATHEATMPTALSVAANIAIAFRVLDTDNFLFSYYEWTADRIGLWRKLTGTNALLTTVAYISADGDVMKVIDDGNNIDIQINDVSKVATTNALFTTATKCGLYMQNVNGRFDDYSVVAP